MLIIHFEELLFWPELIVLKTKWGYREWQIEKIRETTLDGGVQLMLAVSSCSLS